MSIVSLLIGQCGNQVGSEFFKTIYDDNFNNCPAYSASSNTSYINESLGTFFNLPDSGTSPDLKNDISPLDSKPEAKCVQIDMEEKVIRQIRCEVNHQCNWRFSKNYFCSKSGSGTCYFLFNVIFYFNGF